MFKYILNLCWEIKQNDYWFLMPLTALCANWRSQKKTIYKHYSWNTTLSPYTHIHCVPVFLILTDTFSLIRYHVFHQQCWCGTCVITWKYCQLDKIKGLGLKLHLAETKIQTKALRPRMRVSQWLCQCAHPDKHLQGCCSWFTPHI